MSRRKRGRKFSKPSRDAEMARAVSAALREDYGKMSSAVKQIAHITGAKIPTVNNWYQGKNLPGSRYLLRLARASPSILRIVLTEIGGELLLDAFNAFSNRRDEPERSKLTGKVREPVTQNVSKNVSKEPSQGIPTLNYRQAWFLSELERGARATAADIVENWRVDIRTAWRDISALKRSKQILPSGRTRAVFYQRQYPRAAS